jgi:hypothetical protein
MMETVSSGPSASSDREILSVDLALQGDGSHPAFTRGVLDRVLEEPYRQWTPVSWFLHILAGHRLVDFDRARSSAALVRSRLDFRLALRCRRIVELDDYILNGAVKPLEKFLLALRAGEAFDRPTRPWQRRRFSRVERMRTAVISCEKSV